MIDRNVQDSSKGEGVGVLKNDAHNLLEPKSVPQSLQDR